MTQENYQNKFPIFKKTILKNNFANADAVVAHLKAKIDAHPVATFISTFDHYAHTKSLPNGNVPEDVLDTKNLIFCFGADLSIVEMLAVRPRSFGIMEYPDKIIITFLEAPAPMPQQTMSTWIGELE